MTNILDDFSKNALLTAIEANLFEMLPILIGCLPNAVYQTGADATWFTTDIPFPLFNGVIHARLAADGVDSRVRELLVPFETAKKSMIWWTGPSTRPDDLGDHLQAHGLLHLDDTSGMVIDLEELNTGLLLNPAVTVKRVGSLNELEQWAGPFAANFEVPQKIVPQLCKSLAKLGFDEQGTLHHYLGLLNGDVVGTSTLYLGAGVAGMYNVSTLSTARRQGVATALTLIPLCMARDRGYRIGILHSSEMAYKVYRRIGFKVYCPVSHYLYLPNRAQRAFLRLYLWGQRFAKRVRPVHQSRSEL